MIKCQTLTTRFICTCSNKLLGRLSILSVFLEIGVTDRLGGARSFASNFFCGLGMLFLRLKILFLTALGFCLLVDF
jgi:hypothetical protein